MDTRLQRALWDGLADFLERQQLHHGVKLTSPAQRTTQPSCSRHDGEEPADRVQAARGLWLGDTDYAAGNTATGVTGRLRLQVVGFLVHDHTAADDRFLAAHRHHIVRQLEVRFA